MDPHVTNTYHRACLKNIILDSFASQFPKSTCHEQHFLIIYNETGRYISLAHDAHTFALPKTTITNVVQFKHFLAKTTYMGSVRPGLGDRSAVCNHPQGTNRLSFHSIGTPGKTITIHFVHTELRITDVSCIPSRAKSPEGRRSLLHSGSRTPRCNNGPRPLWPSRSEPLLSKSTGWRNCIHTRGTCTGWDTFRPF